MTYYKGKTAKLKQDEDYKSVGFFKGFLVSIIFIFMTMILPPLIELWITGSYEPY